MHRFRFRLTAAAVFFACLLVASLMATPAAKAAITGSTITTPTDPTFLTTPIVAADATGTFAVTGTTSGGDPNTDQVDIRCYYGTTSVLVAGGVKLNEDGSFSMPDVSMAPIYAQSGLGLCRLRAVPAGTTPADPTPYAGPRVTTTAYAPSLVSGGPNDGEVFDYYLFAPQLSAAFDYTSLGDCGVTDGFLFDPTLARTATTFYCNAFLWYQDYWEGGHAATRSELQIDGVDAYAPGSTQSINAAATGLPPLTQTFSVDPANGNLVIHETDPLVKCPDPTYPPTATTCASFVSAGVTDDRTITQDHDGHVSTVSDVFTSTDGQSHTLDMLWDNDQHFQNGSGDSTQVEYEFPGESAYSTHATGDTVDLPASPGTVFIRMHGAADGDTSTGQGAIVYDRPAMSALYMFGAANYQVFTLHQTGTVPAGGSTRFRVAYVQDYLAANVSSMADEASTEFADTLDNTLSVSRAGNGSGSVTSSPSGINCGGSCSHDYAYGTPVTLTATPTTGSTFTGWSGACSGTGGCTVTTNAASSVTAHFSLTPEMLTVAKKGNGTGTVTSAPAGISCGATCSHSYDYGSSVTLTATPATGSTFAGWSGACSGKGTCKVTTTKATSVTATFGLIPEKLTVAKSGNGTGTVSSSPAGISCGATCSHSYDYGSSVTLTATPGIGSTFTGWSGACSGTGTCKVTTNAAISVAATFSLIPETLTVATSGDGQGTVSSSPAGISCGATCSHSYDYGSSVTLTATADAGSSFNGWSGACSGTAACTVSMSAARSVQAEFLKDCAVPKLMGKSLKAAKRMLALHACTLGKVKHAFSKKVKKGRVISQKPKAGKDLDRGAKVQVVISKGKKH